MKSNSYRVVLVSLLMIFSSLAGCLEGDEDNDNQVKYGTVMVSTYHVGELVNAIVGSSVNVEMMSEDNIPVHDYTPSAEDKVRLQGADVFFYHGLGLEPWVEETLESMGEAAPTAMSTHTMPGNEATLDYEGMLISELCELLTEGPYEATTLSMDEEDASEIHAEYVAHTLSFPEMDDDHGDDDHGDDDHGDDDHGDDGHDDHGDHDEHNHADHGHAIPEETIENPAGCPADTVISIFHMEEGEYVLEFEEGDIHEFNMSVLKMNGGHAHHDHHGHGDHDDHGDDDHGDDDHGDDDHGDDDHGEHGDDHDDDMSAEAALQMFDADSDGSLSWDEFWAGWMSSMDDDHDDHGDHDEHSHSVSVLYPDNTTAMFELDHDMLPENATGWDLTNMTMTMNNISLNYSVHEVYGTSVNGINGVDSPDDWSWYWSLQIWNETSEAWESSSVGIDSVMLTHDDNDHIAWAASNADMSLLEEPGHGDHDPLEEAMEEYMANMLMNAFNTSDADGDSLLSMTELENFFVAIDDMEEEFESASTEIMIAAFDADGDGQLSMSEFMSMMGTMGEEDGGHDEHDDHSDEEMMEMMMQMMFNMSDMNSDGFLDASELEMLMEMGEDHAGHVKIHIEAEGDYGFALPHDVEFHVIMGEGGHDDHDDHGDHDDDHDDHDEDDMVCYDMSTHTVDATHTTEADCEAAGLMWTAANSGPGGDDHDDHGDEDDHDDHADEETLDYDPHSWLDPVAFKAQVDVVLAKLIEVFPEGEATFTENAEDFKAELDAIDDAYEAAFGENGTCSAEKTVAANHNAYSYIAVRYDIQFVTVHGLDPEGDPSPEDIANVVAHINEEGLTVLFVEEYTSASSVGSIVQDTGVTVQYLYTMEMAPIDSSDDYLSLMNKNLNNLVAGMGC
tara:strand:+ start:23506 stop:26205 length:2700 start_codon:yes stop_codon:yes gene_type:complete